MKLLITCGLALLLSCAVLAQTGQPSKKFKNQRHAWQLFTQGYGVDKDANMVSYIDRAAPQSAAYIDRHLSLGAYQSLAVPQKPRLYGIGYTRYTGPHGFRFQLAGNQLSNYNVRMGGFDQVASATTDETATLSLQSRWNLSAQTMAAKVGYEYNIEWKDNQLYIGADLGYQRTAASFQYASTMWNIDAATGTRFTHSSTALTHAVTLDVMMGLRTWITDKVSLSAELGLSARSQFGGGTMQNNGTIADPWADQLMNEVSEKRDFSTNSVLPFPIPTGRIILGLHH